MGLCHLNVWSSLFSTNYTCFQSQDYDRDNQVHAYNILLNYEAFSQLVGNNKIILFKQEQKENISHKRSQLNIHYLLDTKNDLHKLWMSMRREKMTQSQYQQSHYVMCIHINKGNYLQRIYMWTEGKSHVKWK